MTMDSDEEKLTAADTGYVPGWDFGSRWRNTFSYLTGKMNIEGQRQWRRDSDLHYEESDCKSCEKHRDHLLAYSEQSFCRLGISNRSINVMDRSNYPISARTCTKAGR